MPEVMCYSGRVDRKSCQACGKETRVGTLCVHSDSETGKKNHFHCQECSNESVANLPPQHVCITCLTVPKSKFSYHFMFAHLELANYF